MRKIIVITMITLDGVMQAPGGTKEDTSDGFKYGGWTASYVGDNSSQFFVKNMQPAEYLMGKNTFDIFAGYWPKHTDVWPGINDGMKYVLSDKAAKTDWQNTKFLKNIDDIKRLKKSDGVDLQVWGSSQLIQLLLKHDLVDELRLVIYPLTLGQGKKLFGKGTIAAAFRMTESTVNPSGVIMANYARGGKVKTGNVDND